MIEVSHLTKTYGRHLAVDDVSFAVEDGQICGLLGPNGSGKTTLIKLANGLIKPTSGQVLIEGMAPCVKTKAKVAYLPDRDFLPEYMSTAQLLDYYEDFFADFDRERALGMLADLGAGLPAARQRKVTACARVQVASGLNLPSPVPPVMPFSTAQATALA